VLRTAALPKEAPGWLRCFAAGMQAGWRMSCGGCLFLFKLGALCALMVGARDQFAVESLCGWHQPATGTLCVLA
jgi:hypothetical protein